MAAHLRVYAADAKRRRSLAISQRWRPDQIETMISVIRSYPIIQRSAEVMGMMEGVTTLSDTTLIVPGCKTVSALNSRAIRIFR